jgi:hypothetical protein
MEEDGDAAQNDNRLQPDRADHPFENFRLSFGDVASKRRSHLGKPQIEEFAGDDGVPDCLAKRRGHLLSLTTGNPAASSRCSSFDVSNATVISGYMCGVMAEVKPGAQSEPV